MRAQFFLLGFAAGALALVAFVIMFIEWDKYYHWWIPWKTKKILKELFG